MMKSFLRKPALLFAFCSSLQAESLRLVPINPFTSESDTLLEKVQEQQNMINCQKMITQKMNAVLSNKSLKEIKVQSSGFLAGINLFSVYFELESREFYYHLTSGPIAPESGDGYVKSSGYNVIVKLNTESCDIVYEKLDWGRNN